MATPLKRPRALLEFPARKPGNPPMTKNDDRGERLGSLELEPRQGKPPTGKAVFHADTRAKGSDRRTKGDDRRAAVRVQEPRRKGPRRPKGAWDEVR
jgi:hypothetical protein